jgi:hypothetical protein
MRKVPSSQRSHSLSFVPRCTLLSGTHGVALAVRWSAPDGWLLPWRVRFREAPGRWTGVGLSSRLLVSGVLYVRARLDTSVYNRPQGAPARGRFCF